MSHHINNPQGRPNSFQDRVESVNRSQSISMACECGSTFFVALQAQEYANRGYGSAQIQGLSAQPETLYVCACGKPVQLNEAQGTAKGGDTARARFLKSIECALKHRETSSPQTIAQGVVSIAEHEEALGRIEVLEASVEALVAHLNGESEEDADDEDADGSEEQEATGAAEKDQTNQPGPAPHAAKKAAAKKSAAKKAA